MKMNHSLVLDVVVRLAFLCFAIWIQEVYTNDPVAHLVSYLMILFNLFTIFYDTNFRKEKDKKD